MSQDEYLAVRTYWRWQHDYRRANPPWSRFYGRKFFSDPELAELSPSARLIALGLVALTAENEKEVDPREITGDPEVCKTWARLEHERGMTCRVGVLKVDIPWTARELSVSTRETRRALEVLTDIAFVYRGSWQDVASRNLADFTHVASKKLARSPQESRTPATGARAGAEEKGSSREAKPLSTTTVPETKTGDASSSPDGSSASNGSHPDPDKRLQQRLSAEAFLTRTHTELPTEAIVRDELADRFSNLDKDDVTGLVDNWHDLQRAAAEETEA